MGMYVCEKCVEEHGLTLAFGRAVAQCELCLWLKGDHSPHHTAFTNDVNRVFFKSHDETRAEIREQLRLVRERVRDRSK